MENDFNILNYFNPDNIAPELVRLSEFSRDFANAFGDGGPGGQQIVSWQMQLKVNNVARNIAIPLDFALTFSKEYDESSGDFLWSVEF